MSSVQSVWQLSPLPALSVIYQWRFEISAQRFYITLDGARGTAGAYRHLLDGRAAARANLFVKLLQARQGAHMYTRCVIGLLALHMTNPHCMYVNRIPTRSI